MMHILAFSEQVADALAQETRLPPPKFLQAHWQAFQECDTETLQTTLDTLAVTAQSERNAAQARLNWIIALEEHLMNLPAHLQVLYDEFYKKLGRDTFREPFALSRFARPTDEQVNIMPVAAVALPEIESFGDYRCLHLLLQQGDGKVLLPDTLPLPDFIMELVGITALYTYFVDTATPFRYLYLTIDTLFVNAGETQRTPGWHVDCLQGDEVPIKKPSQLTFSWCDTLPMQYADQSFVLPAYVNVSEYNIFECLAQLVKPESIRHCEPNTLYAMNTYCVHRSAVAKTDTPRTFIRLSYTHVPITNTKATLNPKMDYDYVYHTTAGNIPKHLKTTLDKGAL